MKEASITRSTRAKPRQAARRRLPSRPVIIDFHAHIVVPEVAEFSRGHATTSFSQAARKHPKMTKRAEAQAKKWAMASRRRMADFQVRLREMDKAGVDIQVLTTSLISQFTYWANPQTSLKMERLSNDRMAEIIAAHPDRFVGLGGVPLQSPKLAVKELERCMGELGLKGVQISSMAGDMELGDARLRPFWARAEALGAVIYIHPAGVTDKRYMKHQLWNSIGQPLEEAMAMASLFYEGIVDDYPKLKIVIAHGGGYLPFYPGRSDRNYFDKPYLRLGMTKSPSEYMKKAFYYDSCVYDPDAFEFLVRKVGAKRIVLGSDYPVGEDDPAGFVRAIRSISAKDKEGILSGNAARLLNISL